MSTWRKWLIAVAIIILGTVILELTVFNRPYYSHFWQGTESAGFETVDMDYKDGVYTPMTEKEKGSAVSPAFVFNGLDRKVNSVYIEPPDNLKKLKPKLTKMTFSVGFADQNESNTTTSKFDLVPGFNRTFYQEINPYGNVSSLKIIPDGDFAISSVAVNKVIPMQFDFIRVLLICLIALGIYFLAVTEIKKTSFDPSKRLQNYFFIFSRRDSVSGNFADTV